MVTVSIIDETAYFNRMKISQKAKINIFPSEYSNFRQVSGHLKNKSKNRNNYNIKNDLRVISHDNQFGEDKHVDFIS